MGAAIGVANGLTAHFVRSALRICRIASAVSATPHQMAHSAMDASQPAPKVKVEPTGTGTAAAAVVA